MNTRIIYLYRDASNNKQSTSIVLEGPLIPDQIAAIEQACDEERSFIPGDVGLPELQSLWVDHGCPLTDDDHVWHELIEITVTNDPPTMSLTAEALYTRFVAVTHWDVDGAMARVGLVSPLPDWPATGGSFADF